MKRKSSRKARSTRPTAPASIPRDRALWTEPWKDFFNRVEASPSPSVADMERLIRFWKTWPGRWADAYFARDIDASIIVEVQYEISTRVLMAACEQRGIDSAPLAISAGLCKKTLTSVPKLGHWPTPETSVWPECLEGIKKLTLRPDQAVALTAASAVLLRLKAKIGPIPADNKDGKSGGTPTQTGQGATVAPWITAAVEIADAKLREAEGGALKAQELALLCKGRSATGHMSEATFRKNVSPELLKMGFKSRRGAAGGLYYPNAPKP
jgi:hypothetical protein